MHLVRAILARRSGQSLTESIVVAPIFFAMVFGMIQLGQLGVAIIIANYGASSLARKCARDNCANLGNYEDGFKHLMCAGISAQPLAQPVFDNDTSMNGILTNCTVTAGVKVRAFPFIGDLANRALANAGNAPLDGGPKTLTVTGNNPYYFVIYARATARMNYKTSP